MSRVRLGIITESPTLLYILRNTKPLSASLNPRSVSKNIVARFRTQNNCTLHWSESIMEMMKYSLAIVLSLCLVIPLTHAKDVKYCDKKGNYPVKVKGVEISPDPVARGAKATFSISAVADDAISGGKLVIDVSYFGFHIHSETHDLCSETSCPVSGGDFVVAHSQVLPGYTPPGSYSLKMTMYDGKNHELTCIAFDFSIGFASSVADS